MLPMIWDSEFLEGGINDLSVYIHYCGWYLRGWVWLYIVGRGVVVVLLRVVVFNLGALFQALENLTL